MLRDTSQLPYHSLLDHLVRQDQERWWHRDPERLGGLEIDDQLELHRLLDGQVSGLAALQNLVHVGGGAPVEIGVIRAVAHEAASLRDLPPPEHRRQPVRYGQLGHALGYALVTEELR